MMRRNFCRACGTALPDEPLSSKGRGHWFCATCKKERDREKVRRWRVRHPDRARQSNHSSYLRRKAKGIKRQSVAKRERKPVAKRERKPQEKPLRMCLCGNVLLKKQHKWCRECAVKNEKQYQHSYYWLVTRVKRHQNRRDHE